MKDKRFTKLTPEVAEVSEQANELQFNTYESVGPPIFHPDALADMRRWVEEDKEWVDLYGTVTSISENIINKRTNDGWCRGIRLPSYPQPATFVLKIAGVQMAYDVDYELKGDICWLTAISPASGVTYRIRYKRETWEQHARRKWK